MNMEKKTANNEIQDDEKIIKLSQYLLFSINNSNFAVHSNSIIEVIEYNETTKVPHMSNLIRGVINLRGLIVPVIDLSFSLFSSQSDISFNNHIILFKIFEDEENIVIGALIDSVKTVINISSNDINKRPDIGIKINPDYIDGIIKYNEEFVILLNIKQILNINELSKIEGFDIDFKKIISTEAIDTTKIEMETDEVVSAEEQIQSNNYVVLSIGNEYYAVETELVEEIVGTTEMTTIPNTLPFMKGVVELRGTIVPLIDMRLRCDLEEKKHDKSTAILIITCQKTPIGLIVDSITDVVTFTIDRIQNPPDYPIVIDKYFVKGLVQLEDKLIIIIDVNRVLSLDELDLIKQLKQGHTNNNGVDNDQKD